MAGFFELIDGPDGGFRVKMLDGDGLPMAISVTFATKDAAVDGIALAREIAGTASVLDHTQAGITPNSDPGNS